MSTLETRIAEVLAAHKAVGLRGMGLRGPDVTADCKCGVEVPGGPEGMRAHQAAALAPVIREQEAEALEKFGHMYLNPEQDENYNKTARAGRGYYRALIETRAKQIRSNDE